MVKAKRVQVPKSSTGTIPPHRHCQVCHKPIPLEESMCSEACKLQWQTMMKKKRKQLIFIWIMAAVIMVMAFIFYGGI